MESESGVSDSKFISLPRRYFGIPKMLAVYMLFISIESFVIVIPWFFNNESINAQEIEIAIMAIGGSITTACLLFGAISLFAFYSFGKSFARFAITVYVLNFTVIYFHIVPGYWTGTPVFSYLPHLLKHINIGAAVWLVTELFPKERSPERDAVGTADRRLLTAVFVLIIIQGAWTRLRGFTHPDEHLNLYYALGAIYAAAFMINGRLVYALAFIPFLVLFILSGDFVVLLMGIVVLSQAFWRMHFSRYAAIALLGVLCGILLYELCVSEKSLVRQYQAGAPGDLFFINSAINLLNFLKEAYPLGLIVFILFRPLGKELFDEG